MSHRPGRRGEIEGSIVGCGNDRPRFTPLGHCGHSAAALCSHLLHCCYLVFSLDQQLQLLQRLVQLLLATLTGGIVGSLQLQFSHLHRYAGRRELGHGAACLPQLGAQAWGCS